MGFWDSDRSSWAAAEDPVPFFPPPGSLMGWGGHDMHAVLGADPTKHRRSRPSPDPDGESLAARSPIPIREAVPYSMAAD